MLLLQEQQGSRQRHLIACSDKLMRNMAGKLQQHIVEHRQEGRWYSKLGPANKQLSLIIAVGHTVACASCTRLSLARGPARLPCAVQLCWISDMPEFTPQPFDAALHVPCCHVTLCSAEPAREGLKEAQQCSLRHPKRLGKPTAAPLNLVQSIDRYRVGIASHCIRALQRALQAIQKTVALMQ